MWLAVPVEAVVELSSQTKTLSLPRLPPHIVGLMKYHEDALPLLDLAVFLSLDGERKEQSELKKAAETMLSLERVIVVASEGMRVGLLCDRASRVIEVSSDQLATTLTVQDPQLRRFVRSEFEAQEGLILCLNVPALLDEARVR